MAPLRLTESLRGAALGFATLLLATVFVYAKTAPTGLRPERKNVANSRNVMCNG